MREQKERQFMARRAESGVIVAAFVMCIGLCAPASVLAQNVNPGIAPPQSKLRGLTLGEWSARWWKWALETPTSLNPLIDTTGANCAVGQTGHVWFLAGTLDTGDPVVRTCTIQTGTSLFFPAVNAFCVAEGDGSLEAQRACAAAFLAEVTSIEVEIDGVSVNALQSYRAQSPAFDLTLPSDNIFGAPAGLYAPTAADGFYLIVRPLPPGEHTIHIRAEFGADAIDVTYLLTVE